MNLLYRLPDAPGLAARWIGDDREFVRRAGLATAARLARVKKISDDILLGYLPLFEKIACDDRPYVWKALSWALREMAKRRPGLGPKVREFAEKLKGLGCGPARRVASEVLREIGKKGIC